MSLKYEPSLGGGLLGADGGPGIRARGIIYPGNARSVQGPYQWILGFLRWEREPEVAKDLTREVRIVERVEGSHLRKVGVSLNPKPNTRWWSAGA